MTREEQIIQASDKWTYQKPPQYSELVHKTHKVMCAYQIGFIDGAVWADSHPCWISVEDELPPYGQQVLAYSEHNPWAEMWWSERNKEYDAKFGKSGEYLILHDSNGFSTLRDDDNKPIQVTHWMLVEPPAKLSNLERIGKNWKGGER